MASVPSLGHLIRGASAFALAVMMASGAQAQDAQSPQTTQAVGAAEDRAANAPTAAGAPTAADPNALNEIVVTAQFRSENLQKTPLAITAMSSAMLEARSFTSVTQVGQTAPSVTLRLGSSGYGKSTQAYIRGIGQTDYNFALEPAVGFYVDDVYHASLFGSTFDLLDLERVEILRGPQGTLFGKNSIGGAVRLISKKPSNQFEASVEGTYGSFNRIDFRGMINLPLIDDTLALRLSGVSRNRDGYVHRIDFACANPTLAGTIQPTKTSGSCQVGTLGGEDVQAGRAALRWTPTSEIEVNLTAEITRDNSEGAADHLIRLNDQTAGILAYDRSTLIPRYGIPFDQRFVTSDPYRTYATYDNRNIGVFAPPVNTLHAHSFSGDIQWNLTPDIQLRSITAYQKSSGRFTQDADNSPLPVTLTDNIVSVSQFTQELRLQGKIGDFLDWTVGGFYDRERDHIGGFVAVAASGINFDQNERVHSGNKSVFAHGVFHLTDRLNFTGGLRYSSDSKTYFFNRTNEPAKTSFFPGGPFTSPPSKEKRVDYKAGVDYEVTDDVLAYFQFSTGFKGGGINPRPFTPAAAVPFGPEKLNAYEAGLKTQFLDHRLRLNLAGFHSDYTDLQLSANGFDNNGAPSILTANAGRARINGLEAELNFQPIPALLIDASGSYTDFKITNLGAAAGISGGPTLASKPPGTPKWKYSSGVQYTFDIGDAGSITPRFDINYQSKVYNEYTNNPIAAQAGYAVVNGRLTYTGPAKDWSASVAVTNVFDKFYYVNKFIQAGSYIFTGQPSRPREWLVTVRKTF